MPRPRPKPWFKVWKKIGKNRQLRRLSPEVRWLYLILMSMTEDEYGLVAEDGEIFTVEEITDRAAIGSELVAGGISDLLRFGFIEINDAGGISISNFYEFQVDREAHKKRVQRERREMYPDLYMDKSKPKKGTKKKTFPKKCHTKSPPEGEGEGEGEVEEEEEGRARIQITPPVPPTVEEVGAYIAEKNLTVDAQGFVDFYESKGWMVGKNKMKNWQAACRRAENWDSNQRSAKSGDGTAKEFRDAEARQTWD